MVRDDHSQCLEINLWEIEGPVGREEEPIQFREDRVLSFARPGVSTVGQGNVKDFKVSDEVVEGTHEW